VLSRITPQSFCWNFFRERAKLITYFTKGTQPLFLRTLDGGWIIQAVMQPGTLKR
jgi:hypothetical protein